MHECHAVGVNNPEYMTLAYPTELNDYVSDVLSNYHLSSEYSEDDDHIHEGSVGTVVIRSLDVDANFTDMQEEFIKAKAPITIYVRSGSSEWERLDIRWAQGECVFITVHSGLEAIDTMFILDCFEKGTVEAIQTTALENRARIKDRPFLTADVKAARKLMLKQAVS